MGSKTPHYLNYKYKEGKNMNKFDILNLGLEYYKIKISPKLSDKQIDKLEKILKISKSINSLSKLIEEIDISLEENDTSKEETEKYCKEIREHIKNKLDFNIYSQIVKEDNIQTLNYR